MNLHILISYPLPKSVTGSLQIRFKSVPYNRRFSLPKSKPFHNINALFLGKHLEMSDILFIFALAPTKIVQKT